MASFYSLCFLVLLSWCFFHSATSTLVGGLRPIDNKDIGNYKDLLDGLKLAAVKEKEAANDTSDRRYGYVANSLRVESQVVEGILYHVKADMGPSSCAVHDIAPILECVVDATDPHLQACSFKVWSREWVPPKERLLIEDLKCSPKNPGG